MSSKFHLSTAAIGVSVLIALLISALLWGTSETESGVERAIRHNFRAAGLLSQLQVEGEKMRRYEKEMFIYAAVPAKRKGYVKEFDESHKRLLALLGTMQDSTSKNFTDAERADMAKWHKAATFYGNEFGRMAAKADDLNVEQLPADQRAALTLELNDGIKAGKDAFRELLTGADKLRTDKEASAQSIATELDSIFSRLRLGMVLGGLAVIGAVLFTLRGQAARASAAARPAPRVA